MPSLDERDIDILMHYQKQGNRELYWNYLAQQKETDGYGLLALGVVRNDNAPGATANVYAADFAREHSGRTLSEREWNEFGQNLVREDFTLRKHHFDNGRSHLALNLPVGDVKKAHDLAFQEAKIHPNAWTPRELLDAAERYGGKDEAEKVWRTMLDNGALGTERGFKTSLNTSVRYNDEALDAGSYLLRMGLARAAAGLRLQDNKDPNTIGIKNDYHTYNSTTGKWTHHFATEGVMGPEFSTQIEDDRKLIEQLDDTRKMRLERNQQSDRFHPLDQYRNILSSPQTIAGNDMASDPSLFAKLPTGTGLDAGSLLIFNAQNPTQPGHPDHTLYQQCLAGVHRLDASMGRAPDDSSLCMAANLTRVARENGLTQVDHVVLSVKTDYVKQGENVFVVQGAMNDPAHLRAHTSTTLATTTPPDKAFARMAELEPNRTQDPPRASMAVTQPQTSEPEAPRQRV